MNRTTPIMDACLAAISQGHRNWAHSMFKAIRGIGYQLTIRCDDLDQIDISALSLMLAQRRDAVWDGLDICPRTCPSLNAKLCTYKTWFVRPADKHARSLLDLPVSRRCMQRFLRFRIREGLGCFPNAVVPHYRSATSASRASTVSYIARLATQVQHRHRVCIPMIVSLCIPQSRAEASFKL